MSEKMTPLQATQFENGRSLAHEIFLAEVAEEKGCTCQAYEDWFTYDRWQALGYQVRKGEKSTKLTSYPKIKVKDKKTNEEKLVSKRRTNCLFCRCQVKPIEKN